MSGLAAGELTPARPSGKRTTFSMNADRFSAAVGSTAGIITPTMPADDGQRRATAPLPVRCPGPPGTPARPGARP